MKVQVNVSPKILDWLMESIPRESMTDKIYSCIEKWRNGDSTPTFNQIEIVSKALGVPFGYFFLQSPPDENLSLVEYRTVDSIQLEKPSRNLIETMHDMEQIQDWMYNYLKNEGNSPLEYVSALKAQTNPIEMAEYVRKLLKLPIDWYKKSKSADDSFSIIRDSISSNGVIVMMSGIVGSNTHRILEINEFRAFAMVNEYAPLIFINSNDSSNGKLFSLLHEFIHICIGENNLFNDRYSTGQEIKATEKICNATSAELLVPINLFKIEWNAAFKENDIEETIYTLSKLFKCGETVIARRALDQGYITVAKYHEISQEAVQRYNEKIKKNKERGISGGNFYRTLAYRIDKRFLNLLIYSVHSGTTLYTDAFRLTNTNSSTFRTLESRMGGALI